MKKGIALINALLISLVVAVGLALLYTVLIKFFQSTETTRTFSSVREAAKSGVDYALSNLEQFRQQLETSPEISTELPCRIEGRSDCRIELQIKIVGNVAITGQEVSGAMYEPFGGSFTSAVFLIRSSAISGDHVSVVEAVVQK